MDAQNQFLIIISTLFGILLVFIIVLILFIDFRDLILSKRIRAKVIRIVESPWTDDDGGKQIMRYPEIEFVDPNGKTIIHQLVLTNITWRKPGDRIEIYYRPVKNEVGYKICAPFVWIKLILLFFLTAGALMLLFGPHTR
jgi:hypothetical protein